MKEGLRVGEVLRLATCFTQVTIISNPKVELVYDGDIYEVPACIKELEASSFSARSSTELIIWHN